MREKLGRGERAVIVALGSSSTAGAGATTQDASYPAVLEAELRQRLPHADIRVVNQGVGGQRANDMLNRLEADVIELHPALVIWQTGVNDAIHNTGVDRFRRQIEEGADRILSSGSDLVLMDGQWLPRTERYPSYDDYRTVMADVAGRAGAGFFRRYDVMKAWSSGGKLSRAEILGTDGLHMTDAGYHCIAVLLADGLVNALSPKVGHR